MLTTTHTLQRLTGNFGSHGGGVYVGPRSLPTVQYKGNCTYCGRSVLSDQQRGQTSEGHFFHESCQMGQGPPGGFKNSWIQGSPPPMMSPRAPMSGGGYRPQQPLTGQPFTGASPVSQGQGVFKGMCTYCGLQVMSNQERGRLNDGSYYHLSCQPFNLQQPQTGGGAVPTFSNAGVTSYGDQQIVAKGVCAICGDVVYNNQERGRNDHGQYYHLTCPSGTNNKVRVCSVCVRSRDRKIEALIAHHRADTALRCTHACERARTCPFNIE